MQFCDSTCQWCARQFFRWWKDRANKQNREHGGRSGDGSFNAAAATSIRPPRDA